MGLPRSETPLPTTDGAPHASPITGRRWVSFLELLELRGWRFKLYGMGLDGRPPARSLIAKARDLVSRTVPRPTADLERPGLGFVTIHVGEHGTYVLIDWWEQADLLHHHLFGAPHAGPGRPEVELRHGWPRGVACCVYEMAVTWHERNAWWRHVLSRRDNPDFDGYLAGRLEGFV